MVFKIKLRPVAKVDLYKAIEYLNDQKSGLGEELLMEVLEVFQLLKENPELFQARYKNIRISYTNRFRYGIHYTIDDKTVQILSIHHTSRNPRS